VRNRRFIRSLLKCSGGIKIKQEQLETVNEGKFVYGINSRCKDGSHIILFDCDSDLVYDLIVYYLQYYQDRYNLSEFHIIKSTNGYNAFCLDKLPFSLVYAILKGIPPCDRAFTDIGCKRGSYTLRVSNDKHYSSVLLPKHKPVWIRSNAHFLFFSNVCNFEISNYYNKSCFDDETTCNIVKYRSNKDD